MTWQKAKVLQRHIRFRFKSSSRWILNQKWYQHVKIIISFSGPPDKLAPWWNAKLETQMFCSHIKTWEKLLKIQSKGLWRQNWPGQYHEQNLSIYKSINSIIPFILLSVFSYLWYLWYQLWKHDEIVTVSQGLSVYQTQLVSSSNSTPSPDFENKNSNPLNNKKFCLKRKKSTTCNKH